MHSGDYGSYSRKKNLYQNLFIWMEKILETLYFPRENVDFGGIKRQKP